MRKVVIVGAGPIGLYLAICLKKLGIADVTVIDPRANQYTRHGDLDNKVFFTLSQLLETEILPSSSRHIKDVERQLYKIAAHLNISILNASFIDFDNDSIKIKHENGSFDTLKADLIFDATGSRRVLINKIKKFNPEAFPLHPLRGATNKTYLNAYVHVTESTRDKIYKGAPLNGVDKVRVLEELREMGWTSFIAPRLEFRKFEKNKMCFYAQIPSTIDKNDQVKLEKWLRKVVELHTGVKDFNFSRLKKSKKYSSKDQSRFNTFPLYPHKLLQAYYQENICVVPVGDAIADPQIHLGTGVINGAVRVNSFISAIKVKENNEFEVDFDAYVKDLAELIEEYEEEVDNYYGAIADSEIKELFNTKEEYLTVLDETDDEDRDDFELTCEYLSQELSVTLQGKADELMHGAMDDADNIKLDQHGLIFNEDDLAESVDLFSQAIGQTTFSWEQHAMVEKIIRIAFSYKKLADDYYHKKQFGSAIKCYKESLNLLTNHVGDEYHNEINSIHIALLKTLVKAKHFDRVYIEADKLLVMSSYSELGLTEEGIIDVKFYQTLALLYQLQNIPNIVERAKRKAECEEKLDIILMSPNLKESNAIKIKNLFETVFGTEPIIQSILPCSVTN